MSCGLLADVLFGVIRVNDQSQFTHARMAGEFRLYVHPDDSNRIAAASVGSAVGATTGGRDRRRSGRPTGRDPNGVHRRPARHLGRLDGRRERCQATGRCDRLDSPRLIPIRQ
jgi:hypothetical protein